MTRHVRNGCGPAALAVALSVAACGPRERDPETPDARRERGLSMIQAMSDRLAASKSIAVETSEEISRITRTGERRVDTFTRELKMRRPDRLYSRTRGARELEIFYEGSRLTVISHPEKVYGELATPPTIDETVDVLSDRYDIALPIGDLLTDNPRHALISSEMTGGWAGRERVDGTMCARLAWQHPRVDWTIWIPESGEPLPRRLHIIYKARRGQPDAKVDFRKWDLHANIPDETFARHVPADYDGIAVIQRASALAGSAEPPPAATSGKR